MVFWLLALVVDLFILGTSGVFLTDVNFLADWWRKLKEKLIFPFGFFPLL